MILKDLPIGTIVTDKKTKFNGKSIEWLVVDHEKYQDGTVLLSKDILCCKPFDTPKELSDKEYKEHLISWENSDIRNWLNTDFFYKSFSLQLRCMSILVEISECDGNNLTRKIKDNVFLLSSSEIGYTAYHKTKTLQLFKDFKDIDRNKYTISEVCLGLKWSWWIRSPSPIPSPIGVTQYFCSVDDRGLLYGTNAYYGSMGIRPACVISDYAPIKKKENGDYKFDWLSLLKFD